MSGPLWPSPQTVEFQVPTCDKCGAEITTGFMVFFCPQREQCEFFEADWDDEMKDFVRAALEGSVTMTPISYMSEQPLDYAKALNGADNLTALRRVLEAWKPLAEDAWRVGQKMTTGEFEAFKIGLRKERRGHFAGDEFSEKYGAIMMPEVMFKVSMTASQFGVPWGCAYLRLKETGNLPVMTQ